MLNPALRNTSGNVFKRYYICGITVQQLADLDEWFKAGKLVSITGWPTSPFFSFMNDVIPFGSCGRSVLLSCRSSSLIFWNMRLRYTFFITPLLNMWANSLFSPFREDSDLIPQASSHDKTSPRGSRRDSLWNRTAVSLDPIYSHSVEKCFCGNDGCHYIVELCRWWCLSVYRTVCPLHTGGKTHLPSALQPCSFPSHWPSHLHPHTVDSPHISLFQVSMTGNIWSVLALLVTGLQ